MSYDETIYEQLEGVKVESDFVKKISSKKASIFLAIQDRYSLDELDNRLLRIIRELDR